MQEWDIWLKRIARSLNAHGTFGIVETRAIEVYDNYFGTVPQNEWGQALIFWRGGGSVCFNNDFGPYGTTYLDIGLQAEGSVEKCWPRNVYMWKGTGNRDFGSWYSAPTLWVANQVTDKVVIDRDYFLNVPMPNYTPCTYPFQFVSA